MGTVVAIHGARDQPIQDRLVGEGVEQVERAFARIDERIAEMQRLRDGLTGCIGCGCLSLDYCSFANPDDRIGRSGPGPRFWS